MTPRQDAGPETPAGKRVLVCGGRAYADKERVFGEMDLLHRGFGITAVIHGGASGADSLAGRWARESHVPEVRCPANWREYGPAAGPIRNAEMLKDYAPDLVLAFPGGKGTEDMLRRALAAGVSVVQVLDHSALDLPVEDA